MKLNHSSALTFCLVMTLFFGTVPALAMPGLSFGLMAGATKPSFKNTQATLSGDLGLSGGASLVIGSIEASALYTQYKLSNNLGGQGTVKSTINYLDIPVLYRIELGPLSLGAGGFYGLYMSTSPTSSEKGASNYGASASFRFTLPVVGLFADARYQLGLKESSGGNKISSAAVYLG